MTFHFTPQDLAYLRGRLDSASTYFDIQYLVDATPNVLRVTQIESNGEGFSRQSVVEGHDRSHHPLGRLNQRGWRKLCEMFHHSFATGNSMVLIPDDFPRNRIRPPAPKPRSRLDRLLAEDTV